MSTTGDRELRIYAEYDWVVPASGRGVLHHAQDAEADADDWVLYDVLTSCGRPMEGAYIPGMLTRMGAKRCSQCCDRLGYPRGIGSPKNDEACRELLRKRIEEIKR